MIDQIVYKYLEHRRVMAKLKGHHYEYEFHESPYFNATFGGLDYHLFNNHMEFLAREFIKTRLGPTGSYTPVHEPDGPGHVEAGVTQAQGDVE